MNTIENAKEIISSYKREDGKKLRIMEVCGTHTHEIFRLGIRKLLPESVELISGPGCPVCVTPIGFIDEACMLALEKGAVICTFGDLIRVPGTEMSLAGARSKGAVIKTVYSPLDAVSYAESHRDEQVVFLAVGFDLKTSLFLVQTRPCQTPIRLWREVQTHFCTPAMSTLSQAQPCARSL